MSTARSRWLLPMARGRSWSDWDQALYPDFLYQPGAGPLLDMGPYYLTALLHIVGPFSSVSGMSAISFPTRTVTSHPHYGQVIQVNVPTYVNALLRFSSGAMAAFTATFDVWKANLPFLEIYGSKGSLSISDPNLRPLPFRTAITTADWVLPIWRGLFS